MYIYVPICTAALLPTNAYASQLKARLLCTQQTPMPPSSTPSIWRPRTLCGLQCHAGKPGQKSRIIVR